MTFFEESTHLRICTAIQNDRSVHGLDFVHSDLDVPLLVQIANQAKLVWHCDIVWANGHPVEHDKVAKWAWYLFRRLSPWAGGEAPPGNTSARGQLQLNGKISVKEKTIGQRFVCEKGLGAHIDCGPEWMQYNGRGYRVSKLKITFMDRKYRK